MNQSHPARALIRNMAGVILSAAMILGLTSAIGWSAEPKATAGDKAAAAKPEKKTEKKLTGAELYAIHCNRCHAERYPTERTDAQWKTIMLHMQTRAQLPGKDAKAILKYLQQDN